MFFFYTCVYVRTRFIIFNEDRLVPVYLTTKNMIIDGNESILDSRIQLNKTRLEGYISVGMKKSEILTAFNVTTEEMEEWCLVNYNMNYNTVFEVVRQIARGEYLDCLKDLGVKGNPTALSIVDRFVNSDDNGGNTGMVFNVNVRTESSDDKKYSSES